MTMFSIYTKKYNKPYFPTKSSYLLGNVPLVIHIFFYYMGSVKVNYNSYTCMYMAITPAIHISHVIHTHVIHVAKLAM